MRRRLVLFALVVATLGCHSQRTSFTPAGPNSLKAPLDSPHIPIFYCPYFEPEELTEAQLTTVLSVAAETRYGAPIWFIFVHYHRDDRYRVEIYYVPERDDALRRGKSVFINSEWLPIRHEMAKRLGESAAPRLHEYVQIPPRNEVKLSTPAFRDLPFTKPDWLSEQQLLPIVLAARIKTELDGKETDLPVCRITRDEAEDRIHVYFGWQVGPLNGRGTFVELERSGDGYVPVGGVGRWVS